MLYALYLMFEVLTLHTYRQKVNYAKGLAHYALCFVVFTSYMA